MDFVEAVRLGCEKTDACTGHLFTRDADGKDKTCLLGAALVGYYGSFEKAVEAAGAISIAPYRHVAKIWPELRGEILRLAELNDHSEDPPDRERIAREFYQDRFGC